MKKKKHKAGRKPLPPGLKKVMLRLFIEENKIEAAGGKESFLEKCKNIR